MPLTIGLALLYHAKNSISTTKKTVAALGAATAPALTPTTATAATSVEDLIAALSQRVDELGAALSAQQKRDAANATPPPPAAAS